MTARKKIPKDIETAVLVESRRRCCLCVFLNNNDDVRRGQIAHINKSRSDNRSDNLVWLCFEHHDEFDSTTSQSKGITSHEIKAYRKMLYERHAAAQHIGTQSGVQTKNIELELSIFDELITKFQDQIGYINSPWRFPLWQVANKPELFAYKTSNGADAVCIIERINTPNRNVVVMQDAIGNPGMSITNSIEELCFQLCYRFNLSPACTTWITYYESDSEEWERVNFDSEPPDSLFTNPAWTPMTMQMWNALKLCPLPSPEFKDRRLASRISKQFDWPDEAILTES